MAVALSLLLTLSFGFSATLHLAVKNTRLRPLSTCVAWSQPLVIPALLLLTLNLYSSPSSTSSFDPTATAMIGDKLLRRPLAAANTRFGSTASSLPIPAAETLFAYARASPFHWERLLRTLSPVFVILEGLCTLLCIQAMSRFTLARVETSQSPDLARMAVLIVAAGVYVASAYFLWEVSERARARCSSCCFSPIVLSADTYSLYSACLRTTRARTRGPLQSYGAVPDRISSTLIGVAVTTILFLSGISFSIHKGNVIESSLMLAYAVFQIFHLSSRPEMYTGGLLRHVFRATGTNGHPPLPPVVLQSCVFFLFGGKKHASPSACPFFELTAS